MSPGFHTLTINRVRQLTDQSVAIRFAIPDALKSAYRFIPGQYVSLQTTINEQSVRRSYSISSACQDSDIEVGIKRVRNGLLSTWAQQLHEGEAVEVMTPQGRFTANPGGHHQYLLIAAGSGITPCLSIIKSVLHAEPDSSVSLIYANRDAASVMFQNDLNALKDRYLARFKLLHVLSGEPQDVDFLNGRINTELLDKLIDRQLIQPATADGIFLCGPQLMTESLIDHLQASGLSAARIHRELFTTAETNGIARQAASHEQVHDNTPHGTVISQVELILDGRRRTIDIDANSETVLQAARRQGLDVPYSCSGGMCCTCRCRILTGAAEMDVNYSLQSWEVEAGYTLACQARPRSASLVLDFDTS